MKSILPFILAALCIVGLAVLDRHAHGDAQPAAALVDAGPAAPPVLTPPEIDAGKTASDAFDAFKAGKYFVGVGLLLLVGVAALRKWGGRAVQTDRGGALLALLAGQLAAFITLASSGIHVTPGILLDTFVAGVILSTTGAGTRHLAKNAAAPPDGGGNLDVRL